MSQMLREQAGEERGGLAGVLAGSGRYLGPGVVVATRADRIELELEGGERVDARAALPWPYEAAVGDELLVVGEGARHFVIGVLRGRGAIRLDFEGDVKLSATGRLDLAADKGVSIRAPDVHVESDRLTIVAEAAHKIVGTLRQTVRDLFTLRAKEQHTLVEGNVLSHSKATRIVSEEKVTINGKEIFLG
ncbi:MAG: DUF3540 domain-containing protein [Polyangiaceae bacterium]